MLESVDTASLYDENERERSLLSVQNRAKDLFRELASEKVIKPGLLESEIDEQIFQRARDGYGVEKHWHKRIVRSGGNTLARSQSNPPDRRILEDDIVMLDLGPVFEEWEADYGKTFVVGDDESKRKICEASEQIYFAARAHYRKNPEMTGAELYEYVRILSTELGYLFDAEIAGHLISEFPHAYIAKPREISLIHPANETSLLLPDHQGRKRYWILEVKIIDPNKRFAAFYEDFLNI